MLDKFRETAITWDTANLKIYDSLRVSAGDNKGRKLSVQVVNVSVVEDLPRASLFLFWETKDKAHKGLDVFTAVDATRGEFEIYYTTGMLSNEGTLNANLVLVDTNGRIVSEPFKITVFKGIDDDAIQSSDSFTALTEALIDINDLEQNYAPRLSTLEQNDVSLSQQLQQVVTDLKNEISQVPNGAPSGSFASLSELTTAFPSGNSNIYVIDDQWYFWSGTNWTVGGSYGGGTPSENSVGESALKDFVVTERKIADLSVGIRTISPETVAYNQAESNLKERIKLIDKQYSTEVDIIKGDTVSEDTLVKLSAQTATRNSVGIMTINGVDYDQLSDDIVEDDAIKTKFKKWSFLDALGDIDAISWFTTYTDSIRIRSSKVVFANDILINRNNVFPVGTVPNWSFIQQNQYDSQQNVDYIASHDGVYGLSINVTRATLTAAGKPFSLQGVKDYLKTLVDFEIYCKTATESFVPAFYRPCLTTFLLNAGEKIEYNFQPGSVINLKAYQQPRKIFYNSNDLKPLSRYMTNIKSNTSFNRTDEIVKLKVSFEDGECISSECIRVLLDGLEVPFDYLKNSGDQPTLTDDHSVYPSGCLRNGYILLCTDLTDVSKVVTVETYNHPINHEFDETVILNVGSDTNFTLTANEVEIRMNGTQGFSINDLALNDSTIATTHLQQLILTDASGADNVLRNNVQPTLKHFGDGVIYRGVEARYTTSLSSGVDVLVRVLMYANGRVETERVLIFNEYLAGFKGIKFKNYFYQPGFAKLSDLSSGGAFGGKNFVFTNHDVQYVQNGGSDGFVSPKVTSVTSGYGTGGYTASISVDNITALVPDVGDYFSTREIYSFSSNDWEDIEIANMNPVSATLSKKLRRTIKNEIKETIATIIDNAAEDAENWRLRVGRTALLMAYHEINGTVETGMSDILDIWTESVGTFRNATKMWNLYVDGLGIEYQGRNQQMLPEVIAFFARHGLTEQKLQAETMLNDFCQFYVQVETYSGANGSVYLGYGTDRDNLNAEAAVLNGWYYKKQYTGSLSASEQSACERVESKFLRSIRFENVLPYIEGDNLLHQFKLHYALFSTYAYAEHASDIPYDITAHAEAALTPNGKIYEMAFDWQATRRGQPHTSLYAIYLLLMKNDISSIQEAQSILKNLELNSFPTGGLKVPMDEWVTHEESSTLNTLISLMVATKIYDYIV